MKKILFILAGLLLSIFATIAQNDQVSKTINSNDSLTVNVKFAEIKLSKEEVSTQAELNTILSNSVKTTEVLSSSLNRLTSAVEEGLKISQLTKADLVADQLGITKEVYNKHYKRNNTLILISLLPALLIAFWSMSQFLTQKGLDIKHVFQGTALLTLYGIIGSGILYALLSLIFNKQYFVIKDLMNSLF